MTNSVYDNPPIVGGPNADGAVAVEADVPMPDVSGDDPHQLCCWCWQHKNPGVSPYQDPVDDRLGRTCCECGESTFCGIRLSDSSHTRFSQCDHDQGDQIP